MTAPETAGSAGQDRIPTTAAAWPQEVCRDCSDKPCVQHLPAIRAGIDYDGWADR